MCEKFDEAYAIIPDIKEIEVEVVRVTGEDGKLICDIYPLDGAEVKNGEIFALEWSKDGKLILKPNA